MKGRPFTTLHSRTAPSTVTTQRTCMLPSTPRATTWASGAGAWVSASTTTPITLAWIKVPCASAPVASVRLRPRTARRIDLPRDGGHEKSSRNAAQAPRNGLLKLFQHRLLHEVRRQQPLGEDGVVEAERLKPRAQLLLGSFPQIEDAEIPVVVSGRLGRRAEGVAVHLLGGEGHREAHLLLQQLPRRLRRPLAHLQLRIEERPRRALQPELEGGRR